MYDMTKVKKRYFDMKLSNGKFIQIEPPKIKDLKKITEISHKSGEEMTAKDLDDIYTIIKLIMNKNKQNYKVPTELIESMDLDSIYEFINAYIEWLNSVKKN